MASHFDVVVSSTSFGFKTKLRPNYGSPGLVVGYWLRTILSDKNISLHYLEDLILNYYFAPSQWDPTRSHECFALSNQDRTLTKSSHGYVGYHSLCAKRVLSADYADFVRWEMTMTTTQWLAGSPLYFLMGYVAPECIGEFDTEGRIGQNENEMALYVRNGEYPQLYTDGRYPVLHREWKFDVQLHDRFRLDFDFKEGQFSAFYNDSIISYETHILPQSVYLAFSAYQRNTSFQTTLFEVTKRHHPR